MRLYVSVIMMMLGIQSILWESDYVIGTICLVLGVVLAVLFYRRQRNRPGA